MPAQAELKGGYKKCFNPCSLGGRRGPTLTVHLKTLKLGGDQDERVGGLETHLPTMNTSKIQLREEQFSLKTNWKLAERLLYNQGSNKDPHRMR